MPCIRVASVVLLSGHHSPLLQPGQPTHSPAPLLARSRQSCCPYSSLSVVVACSFSVEKAAQPGGQEGLPQKRVSPLPLRYAPSAAWRPG